MDTTLFSQSDWEAILELRHTLHAHPELSGEEQETKKRLMNFISHHTHLQLVDRGSWFYALYEPKKRNGKPAIGFRADMDALPLPEARDLPYGSTKACVAHKCGHDGHSSALAALALLLEKDENILRSVYLIFQSAEETGKGGKSCADFVEAAGLGEVYAFHNLSGYPENAVMVRDGLTQCASKGLTFRFTGKRAHAGTPEEGNNPAPALAKLTLFAQDLVRKVTTDPLKTLLLTLVGLNVGGKDFGISPGEGEISFTLRADEEKDLAELEQWLRRKADQLAAEYGLRRTVTEADPFPATVNHKECAEKVRRAARDLGLTLVPMEKPWRPSEDFGWYLKVCPGALFYVGNGENWPAPHHPAYDFNDRILPTPAALFLKLAED
ncbi:M20 metallopeptidase family protein [Acidaminococcus fermentans]|uniref:M20 metallopeptidase family protein n=1 Tax=Acidaminococcus fermentans TaxID=905 RepID=UPI00242B12F6|nr:M20 family metallopeptidase [Acidaminococcus fermentans]